MKKSILFLWSLGSELWKHNPCTKELKFKTNICISSLASMLHHNWFSSISSNRQNVTIKPDLWSSSGVFADKSDMTVDFPVPCIPMIPTTNMSVWSLRYCNTHHTYQSLARIKHNLQFIKRPLTSMALSHQFIWSSTNLMLCFIFSGGTSLDWPTMAVGHMQRFDISLWVVMFTNTPKMFYLL